MNIKNDQFIHEARWWEKLENNHVRCHLCPRHCEISTGKRGFCFVRQNIKGKLISTAYGKSTGFAIDPIEKKPLNHFFPGSRVLSFGTIGCNLACTFCQNWISSRSIQTTMMNSNALPSEIAQFALQNECKSVAFTYNEPIIFAEYAIDTARYLKKTGIHTVAVTAGYIEEEPRKAFFQHMDAANVDLKAFNKTFYEKYTQGKLSVILDTLIYLKHETDIWLEITNLIIPGKNDDPNEIRQMCKWILKYLGPDVPIHFSAFHPDYKMTDIPKTSLKILDSTSHIAKEEGIHFVYTGNIINPQGDTTFCPECNNRLIERSWFKIKTNQLNKNLCSKCQTKIPGCF